MTKIDEIKKELLKFRHRVWKDKSIPELYRKDAFDFYLKKLFKSLVDIIKKPVRVPFYKRSTYNKRNIYGRTKTKS